MDQKALCTVVYKFFTIFFYSCLRSLAQPWKWPVTLVQAT